MEYINRIKNYLNRYKNLGDDLIEIITVLVTDKLELQEQLKQAESKRDYYKKKYFKLKGL